MDYWKYICVEYKGHDLKSTNINANNKNEIAIFSTSNSGNDDDNPLITNNNNNNNYNKTVTIKPIKRDQERKK